MMLPIGERMTEWIKWEKQQPEDNMPCLFHVKGDFYITRIVTGIYRCYSEFPYIVSGIRDCGCSGINLDDITHWAELPEPPDN